MDCKHEIEKLVGVADGVICTGCGKHFDHIPKQEKVKIAPVQPEDEQDVEKAPKKKSIRKTAAKKGEN